MALRKIGKFYYAYFRNADGKLTTMATGTDILEVARQFERDCMNGARTQRAAKRFLRMFPGAIPPALTLQPLPDSSDHRRGGIAIAKMWDLALTRRKLSKSHFSFWKRFASDIGVKYADQVTPKIALAYLESNFNSGNGKTFNNAKSALNTVFRCCLVEAGLSASPFESIINKRIETVEKHRNLTPEEFDRLYKAAPLHLQIMFMLSRWTCQRLETCARMTPEMFDFDRLVFTIEPGKTARFRKWVCVPIMPELEAYLRPILPQCKPGIPIVRNITQIANRKFSEQSIVLFKRLKIEDTAAGKASFHSIRGTAITYFKELGLRQEDLRSITGHTSDRVEDIYARDIANLQKIAQKARESNGTGDVCKKV